MPDSPVVTCSEQTGGRFRRYRVAAAGRTVFCYNPAAHYDLSFMLKRPGVHPFYTPQGLPVTEQGAHNFGHHKAVWIAHGAVDGLNFYHDGPSSGRITTETVAWQPQPVPQLDCKIRWLDAEGDTLLDERRMHRLHVGQQVHLLEVITELTTPRDQVELAREKHGFFHVRVLDAIDEDDGGRLLASNGREGAGAIMESDGLWIDCQGRIGGIEVGVMIMTHPEDGPQPLFARDYGTIALNPFQRESRILRNDQALRLRYAAAAYDGRPDPEEVYARYTAAASGNGEA